ncbi:ABC transporter F family member 4 isoform X1 [Punica granatum]|uniref:ABC transporter F family member 4 isoform X1 n=1 Tax=Punica granatum TaxID=22663 RepID=A0A6P8BUC7_PUNGR|nr:ABC transporter F family member 4 isoform X1 [Punica granatum]
MPKGIVASCYAVDLSGEAEIPISVGRKLEVANCRVKSWLYLSPMRVIASSVIAYCSLTFEGVRRLIEKDLGFEVHALDVHKRLIKQCLLECLEGSNDADASKDPGKTAPNVVSSDKGDAAESPERLESKKDIKEPSSESEDKMEDSPVMGLLTAREVTKSNKEMKGNGSKAEITESTILKAIRKRASYFKANAEKVTMAGVRRLLEEDLELDKRALDPHKAFIGEQLEKVLNPEAPKSRSKTEKETAKKGTQRKASKKVADGGGSESSNSEEEEKEEDEEEVKVRKKTAVKGRMQKSEGLKKRKTPPSKEAKTSSRKRIKPEQAASDSNTDMEDRGHASEGDESQSSAEKRSQKKEVSTPAYGKRVERLKSVIKSCAMSVPPSIYRKAKQVPEDKRESYLIKELEEILSKEGLSSNPSEKEIKEVKRRKERARELEGIDMSNIVSSSRRRTTSSYIPPPKPKIPVDSEGEESEDTDDEEGEDDDGDDEENGEGNDDSQSEDAGEEEEESD